MSFLGDLSGSQALSNLQGNLSQNTAMNQGQQAAMQQQAAAAAQQQAILNNLYGAQGFGGQTDYYAALAAAYGRGTGGFNAYPDSGSPAAPQVPYDPWGGVAGYNTYGQPGQGAVDSGDPGFNGGGGGHWGFDDYGNAGWYADSAGPGASYNALDAASTGRNFNDTFGQMWMGGQTPQQMQNQPAIDAVNWAGRGVPQLSDFGSQNPFMNYDISNPYGGYVSTGDPGGHPPPTSWTFDDYGNPVPARYTNTGSNIYDRGAYATNADFDQFGQFGMGLGGVQSGRGAPSSGAIGPYMDPFTSYPWNGNPAANVDYRFPQFDWSQQNYINQMQQGLANIGGGSTLNAGTDTGDPGWHGWYTPQDVQVGSSPGG